MWSSLLYGVLLCLFAGRATMGENRLTSCLPEDKLLKRAHKLLARSGGMSAVERMSEGAVDAQSCSEFSRRHFSADVSTRSISPWKIITHTDPDMIPEKYQVAQCLCSGCIINGTESYDYNSAEVERFQMFLKKVPCEIQSNNEIKYSLHIEYKTLPVACTCVHPK